MALPSTKQELIDYSLRELGSPVINIEIAPEQLSDRVDYAIKKFIDRHYDGVTETLYKKVITKDNSKDGYIVLPDNIVAVLDILENKSTSSIEPLDSIEYHLAWDLFQSGMVGSLSDYFISMSYFELVKTLLGKSKSFNYNTISKRLYLRHKQSYIGTSNYLGNTPIADWNLTNCSVTDKSADYISNSNASSTITSNSAGNFGFSYTKETKGYIVGTHTFEIDLKAGSFSGDVTISIQDSAGLTVATKTVTPSNTRWNTYHLVATFPTNANKDIVVNVEGTAVNANETLYAHKPTLYTNSFIVFHGFRSIDQSVPNLWSDEWILKYCTALIKRQWGSNLKKFSGVQLPGAVELNGQIIFDEANSEIEKLDEQFSMEYELPNDFYIE